MTNTFFFNKYLNPHFYLYHHCTKDETLTNHLLFPSFLERLEQTELGLSPPQRLPLGIPIKIAIIEKIESAPRTMGRGKRREPLFSHPPSCRAPARCLFLSPQLPHNTKRPLRRRLRWTGIHFWHKWDGRLGKQKGALLQLGEMTYLYHCNCSVLAIIRNNAHGLYAFQFNSIQFNFIIHTL